MSGSNRVPELPVNRLRKVPPASRERGGDLPPAQVPELPTHLRDGAGGTERPISGTDFELDRAADLILRADAEGSGNPRKHYRRIGVLSDGRQRYIEKREVNWSDMERVKDCD